MKAGRAIPQGACKTVRLQDCKTAKRVSRVKRVRGSARGSMPGVEVPFELCVAFGALLSKGRGRPPSRGEHMALSAQSCRRVVVSAVYDPKGGARNGWRAPVPTWDKTAVSLGIRSETVVEFA